MEHINAYLVGGAVRDTLLGLDVKDKDYVVVGSNASELLALGFEQVGMGFPVFLHPWTNEEYALARREKKVGLGYTGFEFETGLDVTLEEDLSRRDLTINSMAMKDGELVDPFGGQNDLKNKILRHTSEAFAEDPLRVVRLARFYARYVKLGFTVADETMTLASQMTERGDLNELPDERFWRELDKAFDDESPEDFFILLPEMYALTHVTFFKRLIGGLPLKSVVALAKEARKLPKEYRVDAFAANVAPASDVVGLFDTTRAGRMYEGLRQVSLLRSHPLPVDVYNVLHKLGAFQAESHVAENLVMAMRVAENAFGMWCWPVRSSMIRSAYLAAKEVTATPYLHLEGREIGKAVATERVNRIAREMA